MKKNTINIIAGIGKNRALGKGNRLLWNIPEDLQHFKKLTTGHPIIMGRKTFESIGRALPNRTNIVISRDPNLAFPGCVMATSLGQAIASAEQKNAETNDSEIFIIGGGEIYKQALPLADYLYLTLVDDSPDADVFFPDYSEFKTVISKEEQPAHTPPYTFLKLSR